MDPPNLLRGGCQEWQLQKYMKSLKTILTHPIRLEQFASKGQDDLIES